VVTEPATVLVIENDPSDDIRRLGEWLTEAGARLDVRRPHAGEPLPAELDGCDALLVLGGGQQAYPDTGERPGAQWFPGLSGLLRKAVRHRVPTLGICLGGQLLAAALGGTVARGCAGPEIGPGLVARRDAAERDPLFARVPFLPDVIQWHHDEITELPPGAVLLAASTRYPHQAFRLGDRAWGTQFHIECDAAMIADWVASDRQLLLDLDIDPDAVVAASESVLADMEEVWQPFAARFAALARGDLPEARPPLPLLPQ
jgi:GMP synthase-like glutamine amidotransferase